MKARGVPRIALLAWVLSTALTAISLILLVLNRLHPGVHIFDYWLEDTVIAAVFSVIGAVISSRRPENVIGWIFCAIGLSVAADHFVAEYATYALVAAPGTLPGGEAAAWVRAWIWVFYLGLFVFLGLLFPDGRLPSPRWRFFAYLSVSLVLLGAVATALSPGPVDGLGSIQNPLGISGGVDVVWLVNWLVLVPTLVAAASLLLRMRRAVAEERQQLKWFAYAAALASSGAILTYTIAEATGGDPWVKWGGYALFIVGIVGLPTAVAIAILRYRLYDIDLIINRTLVYGTLSVSLGLIYLGSVISLQHVFHDVVGRQPHLAVAASTLAIAALFNPLRHRIQTLIDRRFYRRKYDAQKTLEAFGRRLRSEADLDALSRDLIGVVYETVHPAHVSLWLRPGE